MFLLDNEVDFYHVFQPIVELRTKEVHGFELLLRSEQFKNPEHFFQYAKEQNQLLQVDMQSIKKALLTLKKDNLSLQEIPFFINVFPSTLMDPLFYDHLEAILYELHLQPNVIVFEISEAEKVSDLTILKTVVERLKKKGFYIALDDIGKGESSLVSLLEIEPDIAKVDRYFAKDLSTSSKKQRLIELMVKLLGKETMFILEGFETEADLNVAKSLGVEYGQGFFLGKPNSIHHYLA